MIPSTCTFSLRRRVIEEAVREDRRLEDSRNRRRARALLRRTVDPFTAVPDREFVKTFRLYKDTVRQLASDIMPLLPKEHRSDAIHPMIKVSKIPTFYLLLLCILLTLPAR